MESRRRNVKTGNKCTKKKKERLETESQILTHFQFVLLSPEVAVKSGVTPRAPICSPPHHWSGRRERRRGRGGTESLEMDKFPCSSLISAAASFGFATTPVDVFNFLVCHLSRRVSDGGVGWGERATKVPVRYLCTSGSVNRPSLSSCGIFPSFVVIRVELELFWRPTDNTVRAPGFCGASWILVSLL